MLQLLNIQLTKNKKIILLKIKIINIKKISFLTIKPKSQKMIMFKKTRNKILIINRIFRFQINHLNVSNLNIIFQSIYLN